MAFDCGRRICESGVAADRSRSRGQRGGQRADRSAVVRGKRQPASLSPTPADRGRSVAGPDGEDSRSGRSDPVLSTSGNRSNAEPAALQLHRLRIRHRERQQRRLRSRGRPGRRRSRSATPASSTTNRSARAWSARSSRREMLGDFASAPEMNSSLSMRDTAAARRSPLGKSADRGRAAIAAACAGSGSPRRSRRTAGEAARPQQRCDRFRAMSDR